ncbi:SH3 domain-containing protein [Flavobacterium jejuense]|uniref:SH3 domain-containing protein n=2 Tax=Flavobacterium jejuense TaxID=1544455 RepID=A0ABX0IVP8_9FLAO|nr:SH3 domain-containing protein [Flavobacterium jejuense]
MDKNNRFIYSVLLFQIIFLLISCKNNKETGALSKTSTNDKINIDTLIIETKCSFETYVVYKDSIPLFELPEGNIVKYFRFEDDLEYDYGGGFLFKKSANGWLQIGKDEFNPKFENLWIKSENIEISTNNYADNKINLYEKPTKNSQIIGYINKEVRLNVINCSSDWVFVKYNNIKGWLPFENICTNPVTNCN